MIQVSCSTSAVPKGLRDAEEVAEPGHASSISEGGTQSPCGQWDLRTWAVPTAVFSLNQKPTAPSGNTPALLQQNQTCALLKPSSSAEPQGCFTWRSAGTKLGKLSHFVALTNHLGNDKNHLMKHVLYSSSSKIKYKNLFNTVTESEYKFK